MFQLWQKYISILAEILSGQTNGVLGGLGPLGFLRFCPQSPNPLPLPLCNKYPTIFILSLTAKVHQSSLNVWSLCSLSVWSLHSVNVWSLCSLSVWSLCSLKRSNSRQTDSPSTGLFGRSSGGQKPVQGGERSRSRIYITPD